MNDGEAIGIIIFGLIITGIVTCLLGLSVGEYVGNQYDRKYIECTKYLSQQSCFERELKEKLK